MFTEFELEYPGGGPARIKSVGEPIFRFKEPDDWGKTLSLTDGPTFDDAVERLSQPSTALLLTGDPAGRDNWGGIRRFNGVGSPSDIGRIDLLVDRRDNFSCLTVSVHSAYFVPEPSTAPAALLASLMLLAGHRRRRC